MSNEAWKFVNKLLDRLSIFAVILIVLYFTANNFDETEWKALAMVAGAIFGKDGIKMIWDRTHGVSNVQ